MLHSKRIAMAFLCVLFLAGSAWAEGTSEFLAGNTRIIRIGDKDGGIPAKVMIGDSGLIADALKGGLCPSEFVVFMLERPDERILIDSGLGPGAGGNTLELLEKNGYAPGKVDKIVLTHLHPDHVGGLVLNGKKTFPAATVYVNKKEHDYWQGEKETEFNAAAKNFLRLYKDDIRLFAEDEKIFPWLETVAAPGHTPGHTVFAINEDGKKYILGGDVIHCLAVQAQHPEIAVIWDVDKDWARQTRRNFLRNAADERSIVLGGHFPAPGAVRFKDNGNGSFEYDEIKPEKP